MSSVARVVDDVRPAYSRGELIADAAVHGIGLVGAIAATGFLLNAALASGQPRTVAAIAVYTTCLVAMPPISAGYNLGPTPGWRRRMRRVDQAAIFVLIAGSYTPFAVVALGGHLGFALLALVWSVAGVGVVLKLRQPTWLDAKWSVALYLALGWCALPALGPLLAALEPVTLALLALGGVVYTAGVVFHMWRALPYHNAIWHGFVVAAAACHVFAVAGILGP